jgi:hypothetical protein
MTHLLSCSNDNPHFLTFMIPIIRKIQVMWKKKLLDENELGQRYMSLPNVFKTNLCFMCA